MDPARPLRLTLDQLEQLGMKLTTSILEQYEASWGLPAAVSSWPRAHGHHLVLLALPTTEPLWVGTGPISFLYTQPVPYHVCAEWHPVLAPPSCLFAISIDFPIGNQQLYVGWASWCKHGSPRSCHCKRLPRAPPSLQTPPSQSIPRHRKQKPRMLRGPWGV